MNPERKVIAATLAAALATILVWAIHEFTGLVIPTGVELAFVTLVTFGIGYLVPNPAPAPPAPIVELPHG